MEGHRMEVLSHQVKNRYDFFKKEKFEMIFTKQKVLFSYFI